MEKRLFAGVLALAENHSMHGHDYGEPAPLRTPLLLAGPWPKSPSRL